MKNKSFRIFLLAVVLIMGLLATIFVGPNNVTAVNAEETTATELPVVEVSTSDGYVNENTIRNSFAEHNYENVGIELIDKTLTRYVYYIDGQEVNTLGRNAITENEYYDVSKYVETANNKTHTFNVKVKTGTRKIISYNWSALTDVPGASGSFKVALYSNVSLSVDYADLTGENKPSVALDSEKVYYGETAKVAIEQVEDYNVYVNDKLYTKDTYTIENVTENQTVSVKYEKSTDCKFVVDTDTISGVTLTINGTKVTAKNNVIKVAENTSVTISATPDNSHLVRMITRNGEELINEGSYPNYSATFTVGTGLEYDIAVEAYEATNTLSVVGEGAKLVYNLQEIASSKTFNRDSEVKLTLKPNDNMYIVDFNINLDSTRYNAVYSNGNVEITFTTGANENYVVEYTTATMFNATTSETDINVYDVMLMIDGDEFAKKVVYEALLNDAFNVNFDIELSDVRFEYLAGVYTLNLKETFEFIPSLVYYVLPEEIDVDIYYAVDATNPADLDKAGISEYFANYILNIVEELAENYSSVLISKETIMSTASEYISAENIANALDDKVVGDIIACMHLFGSAGDEQVRLIYAGNEYYQATTVECAIIATDLREEIAFDVNETISVVYGSFADDSYILDMILADRNGVVSLEGEQILGLNETLRLSKTMVGKAVDTYTVTLTFPDNNFYYKGNSIDITVEVTKANVKVDVANNILNYKNTSTGAVSKSDIFAIEPNVVITESVDHIYFVMGLDVYAKELIVNIDFTNIKSFDNDIDQKIMETAIRALLSLSDKDGSGFTLSEFAGFAFDLSKVLGMDGIGIDNSYVDKLTELLGQADQTVDIRIKVVYGEGTIVPQNPGVYLVGVVTTDGNYNVAGDAGYMVITPDVIDVKFANDTNNNNLRVFKFDGTPREMVAEAYDYDEQVAEGTMYYFYVGMQLDGTFYASSVAPVHTGSYSVFAIFSNAQDGGIPSQVGIAVGAMVVVPNGKGEINVNNVTVCENGQEHNIDFDVEEGFGYITIVRQNNHLNIILPSEWNVAWLEEKVNVLTDKIYSVANLLDTYLPDYYLTELQARVNELVEKYDIKTIEINRALPTEAGEYVVYIVAYRMDYELSMASAKLTINVHDLVRHEAVVPTCTEIGWNEYYTCTACDYTTYEEIAALGHTAVVDEAVAPTCTQTGLTEGTHCGVCGETLLEQEVVDALGHCEGEWTEVTAPTCTTEGSEHTVCTVCGEELNTRVIAALGHIEVVDNAVAATCTTEGLTAGLHCEVCGETLVAQEEVAKLPHNAGAWTVVTEASCTAEGIEHTECTVCGVELETREIAKVAHEMQLTNIISAVCTANGRKDYTCKNCTHKEYQTIEALGHNAGAWTVVTAADCTTKGTEHKVCTSCNTELETREIAALGHNEVVDNAVAPTCTATGLTAGSHCDVCGDTLVAQEEVVELGHNESAWTVVTAATCTTKGVEHKVCTVCNVELETRETEKVAHELVGYEPQAPTCTEFGWDRYESCENCTYTTYEQIAALGHNAVVDNAVAATCTATGLTEGSHCSACNEVLVAQQVTAIIAHNFGAWYVETYATATTNGRYARECSECHFAEYQVINAYGDQEMGNITVTEGQNGKASVSENSVQDALKEAAEIGSNEVVVAIGSTTNTLTTVEVTTTSLQQIVTAESSLTIETTEIHATFDKNALATILANVSGNDNVEFDIKKIAVEELNDSQRTALSDKQVAVAFSAQVLSDNVVVSNFGTGKVEVRLPFALPEGKTAGDYKLVYIADDGSIEELVSTYVDGELVVELGHFSEYVVLDISKQEVKMSTAIIVALSVLAAFAVFAAVGIVVVVRKERKR